MPTFKTLRLGPIDGSTCDTLGLDNNPVSRFRYEQDCVDYLAVDVSCDKLYLGVSSLSETDTPRHITLFPNPIEDQVRVTFHDYLPSQASIHIYSIKGELLQASMLTSTSQLIDLHSLTSGVYLYEVRDGSEILKRVRS